MSIILPIVVLGGLGLIFAAGLSYASKRFAVEIDPKIELVEKALAGLNCGVCGFPGCRGYAEAIVAGKAFINKCAPGGIKSVREIAGIMGVEAEDLIPKVAVVRCQGGYREAPVRFAYRGVEDCRAAQMVGAGFKSCSYGCLGLSSCAVVCPFDAISMSENNLPVVDEEKCTACGICVQTCPRGLMILIPCTQTVYLGCANKDRGATVKEVCQIGCIACRLCTRRNPQGEAGIKMDGNLPIVNYENLASWPEANDVCPQKCFVFRKVSV